MVKYTNDIVRTNNGKNNYRVCNKYPIRATFSNLQSVKCTFSYLKNVSEEVSIIKKSSQEPHCIELLLI